jgi:hypothetical protein
MSLNLPAPVLRDPQDLPATLQQKGYAVFSAAQVQICSGVPQEVLLGWNAWWNDLPADAYLRDGGRYRRRRHSSFVVEGAQLTQVPHRPHWQPLEYNALHGGLQRHFEPMPAGLTGQDHWARLLCWLAQLCSQAKGPQPWYVEAHQFRIDTAGGIGRPTPEGAHRDGVDMVAVFLLERHAVKGGETRVFDADGPDGQRFTLSEPWSLLLLDDQRVVHETTPIQPLGEGGWRDTLVVTLRAGGFQDDTGEGL